MRSNALSRTSAILISMGIIFGISMAALPFGSLAASIVALILVVRACREPKER